MCLPSRISRRKGKDHASHSCKRRGIETWVPGLPACEGTRSGIFTVLEKLEPDIIVVAAFGQIIPKSILELPKYGCINIHASLLPKYRGAAPIQQAVIDGEKESGLRS